MKIGLFTDSYIPLRDGVATSVATLAKELKKKGHEVYIVAPRVGRIKERRNIIRLFAVRLFQKPEFWAALEIPQPSLLKILFMKFDIIHGHSGGPITMVGLHVARFKRIPFIATYHTLWKHYRHYFILPKLLTRSMLEKLSALFFNKCDVVIAPSEKVRRELVSYGIKKPIYIIPSGVNLNDFSAGEKNFLHRRLNIPGSTRIILTVGRLGKEKSLGFLLQAYAKAADHFINTVFVIVGEGREKDKQKLIKLAESLEISDRVFFTGGVEFKDMPNVYSSADIFVFASHTETQGMVLMEALASGLPVLAVHDLAFVDVIEDDVNGFMVDREIDVFAKKLIEVMHDYSQRERLSKNAKISAEKFSVEITTRAMEQVYSDTIQKNSS